MKATGMIWMKRGLSLLELIISLSLIAIVILGFSKVFEVGAMGIHRNQQEVIATNLAVGMMSEIMFKPFCDPTSCLTDLGTEMGQMEGRTACDVNTFDDVDDYHNYTDGNLTNGPRDIRGCEMAEFKGFSRFVNVSYVNQDMTPSGFATDFKKIDVTVSLPGISSVSVTEIKANVTQ